VCKFECVNELFIISKETFKNMKKLTNTNKLVHQNYQNIKETSYLDEEEFQTPHALSL
jgi:hypothetical protein